MWIGFIAEPAVVIARRDSQRHAIMYFGYHLDCVGGVLPCFIRDSAKLALFRVLIRG
jgi:hypothetical protein